MIQRIHIAVNELQDRLLGSTFVGRLLKILLHWFLCIFGLLFSGILRRRFLLTNGLVLNGEIEMSKGLHCLGLN